MAESTPTAAPTPGSVTLYDPKTSAPVVVDSADAHALILGGKLNYAPGTRVPARINGQIVTVPADDLGDAVTKYGAKPVTGADYHAAQQQEKYGSTGQAIQTAGESFLDSATLGASNAIIGEIGGKETREGMRGRQEANPTAHTVGDVAGIAVPIAADLLSGGTLTPELAAAESARLAERGIVRAGAGAAASAVLAPMRAVSKVGGLAEGAAKAIVGSEAKTAAGRVAQGIIAGGVRGATEGGLYGVGGEAGHQYLQDNPDLSGEVLGTAWLHGALLGGALGGAVHGVGSMLTTKAPKLFGNVESVEKAIDAGAADGAVSKVAAKESTAADAVAKQIIKQIDDPDKAKLLADAWKYRSFEGHEGMLADANRKVTRSLDEAIESGHVVDMHSFGEAKTNYMRKLVPAENVKPAQTALMNVWADTGKVLDGLEKLPMLGGEKASINRLRMWLDDFGDLSNAEKWKDPAELFDKIDDFKRRIGKEAGFGKGDFGRAESTRQFNALYDRTRLALEDEATWGAAAVAQREVNLATASMIDTNSKFLQRFTSQYGSEAKTGAPKYIADSAKVNGFINGLTSAANDTNAKMATDYVVKRTQFLDAVTKNYDLPAAALKADKAERVALKAMAETIAKTSDEVSRVNQLKHLMADERGHSIHSLVGMAIDAVTKPGLTLARMAELQHAVDKAREKIAHGVGSIRRAINGKAPPPLEASVGPATYEKRRASVLDAASRPDAINAHLAGSASPIAPHAPATAQSFQRAGIRTIQYLMTALPKPTPRAGSLTPKVDMEAWEPSDQEKSRFNRQYDMAIHPERALALTALGTITPQHVDALEATNPARLAEMRAKVQADLDASKKPVPYAMQAPLKTFLGLPPMAPNIQKMMQGNFTPAPKPAAPQQGTRRPLHIADTISLNSATKERRP